MLLFRFDHRRYGTKCGGCGQGLSPTDLVRKARDKVYHLRCFTCALCRRQLSTGEELYLLDDARFLCKEDFLRGKAAPGELPHLLIVSNIIDRRRQFQKTTAVCRHRRLYSARRVHSNHSGQVFGGQNDFHCPPVDTCLLTCQQPVNR